MYWKWDSFSSVVRYAGSIKQRSLFWPWCAISSAVQYVHSQCLGNIMLLFVSAFLKELCCHDCVTPACEAHIISHCIITLSSMLLDTNNNDKVKMRQPVSVVLYVNAEGDVTLADCHWAPSPWGLLLMNQRKYELHILKWVNVSNHSTGRTSEDSSDLAASFLETLVSRTQLV